MADDPARVPLDTGDAVMVDAIGSQVVRFEPSGEVGIVLDLEGKLNKLDVRDAHRYVFSAGLAAELVAEMVVAGQEAAARGSALAGGRDFLAEFEAAVAREQQRRGLERG